MLTSLNLRWFHILPRHRVVFDNIRKRRSREILLAGLLLCTMLARVLLHALQPPRFPTKLILDLLEELSGLFTHLQHPCGGKAEHFCDPCDLIILG